MKRKIGIYPGTFDPIHEGHIAFARTAATKENLDAVYFLPEKKPRNKQTVSRLSTRLKQMKRDIEAYDELDILILPEDTFTTAKTLPLLLDSFGDADLHLLIGSDVLATMQHWDDIDILLKSFALIVGIRATSSEAACREVVNSLLAQTSNPTAVSYVITPHTHMSSSLVRKRQSSV